MLCTWGWMSHGERLVWEPRTMYVGFLDLDLWIDMTIQVATIMDWGEKAKTAFLSYFLDSPTLYSSRLKHECVFTWDLFSHCKRPAANLILDNISKLELENYLGTKYPCPFTKYFWPTLNHTIISLFWMPETEVSCSHSSHALYPSCIWIT